MSENSTSQGHKAAEAGLGNYTKESLIALAFLTGVITASEFKSYVVDSKFTR